MDIDSMYSLRLIALTLGFGLMSQVIAFTGEALLEESFDTLDASSIAGQRGWVDNSKTGGAMILATGSLSTPNHLSLYDGGAVHHAIPQPKGEVREYLIKFACKRNATEAGQNLQFSFRTESGEPALFLNLRGSGQAVDVGPSVHTLSALSLDATLPVDTWFWVEAAWQRDRSRLHLKVASVDGATVYLDQSLELPFELPARLIIGSTPRVQAGEWAVDNLYLHWRP